MPYLVAALVIVAALTIFNLLLTLAVLRKLRHQSEKEARYGSSDDPANLIGQPVPDFSAVSIDGELVVGTDFIGRGGVIGFFTEGCPPCHEQSSGFARLAAAEPSALAVVSGERIDDELVTALREAATVVTEAAFGGHVAGAFNVSAFPTFLRVDGTATVVAAGTVASELGSGAVVA